MSLIGSLPTSAKSSGPATADGDASDPSLSLKNLSVVRSRMDTLQRFLSDAIHSNTLISKDHMDMVSTEIASAIHQIIVNGAALLACTQIPSSASVSAAPESTNVDTRVVLVEEQEKLVDPKLEVMDEEIGDDYEILELDAVELLAEHVHFCEICGKGFKRDANLRMHMRAHGNQFKTPEALAKPEKCADAAFIGGGLVRKTRFSCPYVGCNRNKQHKKFRPLKSAVCVKNHFKRSHCPKMYSCDRCNKKSFSVLADLKSHLKHCGETKWKCSCGTSFSRKDKLFGHMALFEGHMPAVVEEEGGEKGKQVVVTVEDDDEEDLHPTLKEMDMDMDMDVDNGFFDGLLDGFGSIESYSFEDLLSNSPDVVPNTEMDELFNF